MTLLTSLFIAGCGKSLGGVYEKIPGDKVYMSVMGVKTEVKYSIDGKNLKIENAGVNQIMTIQDDGSILYPIPMVGSVVLKKK